MKGCQAAVTAAVLSLCMLQPFAARAGNNLYSLSVTPFAGGYVFEGNQKLQNKPVYGIAVGYNLSEHWAAELTGSLVPDTISDTPSRPAFNVYGTRLDVLYHFFPEQRFVPYLAAGGGGIFFDPRAGSTDVDFMADYGLGFKYFLTDFLALRADIRHIIAINYHDTVKARELNNNLAYTAGLTFQVGGTRAAAPVVAVEKPVTVAEAPRPEPQVTQPAPASAPVAEPAPALVPVPESAPGPEIKAAQVESPPAAAVAEKAAPVESQLPAPVVPALPFAEPAGDCNGCKVNTVTNVVIGPSGVEINSDLGIETYKVFKLSAPTRLVIDICCATYGDGSKSAKIDVNRMGVSNVRVGTHPGKLRVVIDSPLAKFPAYRVEKTERGLNVLLKNL